MSNIFELHSSNPYTGTDDDFELNNSTWYKQMKLNSSLGIARQESFDSLIMSLTYETGHLQSMCFTLSLSLLVHFQKSEFNSKNLTKLMTTVFKLIRPNAFDESKTVVFSWLDYTIVQPIGCLKLTNCNTNFLSKRVN